MTSVLTFRVGQYVRLRLRGDDHVSGVVKTDDGDTVWLLTPWSTGARFSVPVAKDQILSIASPDRMPQWAKDRVPR